jgi:hypothetical protein
MRIEVSKKVFLGMLVAVLVVVGVFWVVAYNSSPANPANLGHSVNEIDWSKMIDSSVFVKNNVGIGTSSPEAKLHINGTGFAGLFVENSGQTYSFYVHDNGNLVIGDENAEAARISVDSTGNVSVSNYLKAAGVCIGDDCRTSWASGGVGGVSKIVAGNGITLSPSEGTGDVTVSQSDPIYWFGNYGVHLRTAPTGEYNLSCNYVQGSGTYVNARASVMVVDALNGQYQIRLWFSGATDQDHHCNSRTKAWVDGLNSSISVVSPDGHVGIICASNVVVSASGIVLTGGPGYEGGICSSTKNW